MSIVYIVSTYNEYGADDAVATLDRDRVIDLIQNFHCSGWDPVPGQWEKEAKAAENYIYDEHPILGKHDLSNEWGGLQLHILELK